MSDTPNPCDIELPEEACRHIRQALDDTASRVALLLEGFSGELVPQALAQAISLVLDSFDDVLRDLCGDMGGVSRHPSCSVEETANVCGAPLRLALPAARKVHATFASEQERLDLLVEIVRQATPEIPFDDWGPILARAMGAIYIEI